MSEQYTSWTCAGMFFAKYQLVKTGLTIHSNFYFIKGIGTLWFKQFEFETICIIRLLKKCDTKINQWEIKILEKSILLKDCLI